jgi:hypothetical protein
LKQELCPEKKIKGIETEVKKIRKMKQAAELKSNN